METIESNVVNELTEDQVDDLRVATVNVLDREFDDKTVAIPTSDCIKILEITGRRHSTHDESRIRAILEENCRVDMKNCVSFHDLKKLAYLMDILASHLGSIP